MPVTELDRLLDAASRRDLGEAERISRARIYADAARNAREVSAALVDVYARGHGPVTDIAMIALRRGGDPEAAARLDRWYAAQQQRAALIATTDTPGLLPWTSVPVGTGGLPASPLLDAIATPVEPSPGSHGLFVADAWTGISAVLDPPEGTVGAPAAAQANGTDVLWHTSALVVDVSRQVLDWSPTANADLSAAYVAAVNAKLEAGVVADIVAGATAQAAGATIADSLDDAEGAAAAAWGSASVIILAALSDAGRVRRAYAGQTIAPQVVPVAGLASGTALVFAREAVALYASAVQVFAKPHPSAFGIDVATLRYGAAKVRKASAVIAAALP